MAAKGMIDVISKYLKIVNVNIGNASPALVLLTRFTLLYGINAMITTKLLEHGDNLLELHGGGRYGYRVFKHATANKVSAKDVFVELATNFRRPLLSRGGSEGHNARTHFTSIKRRRLEDQFLM